MLVDLGHCLVSKQPGIFHEVFQAFSSRGRRQGYLECHIHAERESNCPFRIQHPRREVTLAVVVDWPRSRIASSQEHLSASKTTGSNADPVNFRFDNVLNLYVFLLIKKCFLLFIEFVFSYARRIDRQEFSRSAKTRLMSLHACLSALLLTEHPFSSLRAAEMGLWHINAKSA